MLCHFIVCVHFVSLDIHLVGLQVLAPLAIGLILFVCHLVAIPVDGYW